MLLLQYPCIYLQGLCQICSGNIYQNTHAEVHIPDIRSLWSKHLHILRQLASYFPIWQQIFVDLGMPTLSEHLSDRPSVSHHLWYILICIIEMTEPRPIATTVNKLDLLSMYWWEIFWLGWVCYRLWANLVLILVRSFGLKLLMSQWGTFLLLESGYSTYILHTTLSHMVQEWKSYNWSPKLKSRKNRRNLNAKVMVIPVQDKIVKGVQTKLHLASLEAFGFR